MSDSKTISPKPIIGEVVERRAQATATTRRMFGREYHSSADIEGNAARASLFKRASIETVEKCFSSLRPRIAADEAKFSNRVVQRPVIGFQFDIRSEYEIVKQSVVHVTSSQCILTRASRDARGRQCLEHYQNPVGPLSPFIGPLDRGMQCETCEGTANYDYALNPDPAGVRPCPGHPGHILLTGATFASPFTFSHLPVNTQLLRCICWICGQLPAKRAKCEATIAEVLACDFNGMPHDRRKRLEILTQAMQNEKFCHACEDRLRCEECMGKERRCKSCSQILEFRPKIQLRSRSYSTKEFIDFPSVVTWNVQSFRTEKQRVAFEAFKRRHPRLTETELSLNPERARHMFSVVSPEVALLLAPTLPRGPFRKTGDVYTRVFGDLDPAVLRDAKLTAVKTIKEFFNAQDSRVLSVMEHIWTPTRVNGGLHNISLNESTKIICAIINTNESIKKKAALIPCDDRPAYAPIPQVANESLRGRGTSVDETFVNATIDSTAILRHAPGSFWYEKTRADHFLIAPEYGTLQYYVCQLIDPKNAAKWHPKGSSAPRPGVTSGPSGKGKHHAPVEDLKGKDNLMRLYLNGKRCDFSGRTVITPEAEATDIDELCVPYMFASRWTFPETLNGINTQVVLENAERRRKTVRRIIEALKEHKVDDVVDLPLILWQRIRSDPSLDETILMFGGKVSFYMWDQNKKERFEYTAFDKPIWEHPLARTTGTIVDRPMQNGDKIVFNRAPSLHLVSIMAHTVRLWWAKTCGMTAQTTPPYNADFDGDEMTSHFPQGLNGVAEVGALMPPSANIILPRTSSSIIAQVQDTLTGSFDLSLPSSIYTFEEATTMITAAVTRITNTPAEPEWNEADRKSPWVLPRSSNADARPSLPTPAIMVRCKGNGSHITNSTEKSTAKTCHEYHEELDMRCKRPCNKHFECCQARGDSSLPCTPPVGSYHRIACDKPHWVCYWTGLQLASLFLPPDFSATKSHKFSAQQLGFRQLGACHAPPAPKTRPQTAAELWVAKQRSDARDQNRIALDKKEKDELHRGNIPWCIVDGELLYGTLNKQAVGVSHLNIVQKILMATGTESADDATGQYPERNRLSARRFIAALGKMAICHTTNRGFSVGYDALSLNNPRLDAEIRLTMYGVRQPSVPDELPISDKRVLDPIKYHRMRFDVEKDDEKAISPEELDYYKIPYEKKQVGVERASIKIIHEWEMIERKVRLRATSKDPVILRRLMKDPDAGEMAFSFAKRRARAGARIQSVCDRSRDKVHMLVVNAMTLANPIWKMVSAGSKGSDINTGSMIGCIGQQVSNGKRPCDHDAATLDDLDVANIVEVSRRVSANLLRYPLYPAGAGGMVKKGYKDGCEPKEFFDQYYGCRDGLVDTATKTGDTGYMQRQLAKNCESHRLAADGTVRNEVNKIVSIWPGGVRIDPRFLMSTVCEPFSMSARDFSESALFLPSTRRKDDALLQLCSENVEVARKAVEREAERCSRALTRFRSLTDYDNSGGSIRVPGDINSIIFDTMHQKKCAKLGDVANRGYTMAASADCTVEWKTDLDKRTQSLGCTPMPVEYAIERFEMWLKDDEVVKHDFVTLTHLSLIMTAKQLIVRFQMPREVFHEVLHRYKRFLIFARSQNGDAIGIIVAQSVGEPLTQMTLQTFYVAGREAPVTRGVPRYAELMSMRQKLKTPMVEAHFDLRRVFAEETRKRRRHEKTYLALQTEDVLRDLISIADKSTEVESLAEVMQGLDQWVANQYDWSVDTVANEWYTIDQTLRMPAEMQVSEESRLALVGAMFRSQTRTAMVASISEKFATFVTTQTAGLARENQRAFAEILAVTMSMAIGPLLGLYAGCMCIPLLSNADQLVGFAFAIFTMTPNRIGANFDELCLKRTEIPVLVPRYVDVERAALGENSTVVDLSVSMINTNWNEVSRHVNSTPVGSPEDENSNALETALLLPARQTIPRITLGDIIDFSRVEYAPLVCHSGTIVQKDEFQDCNDAEKEDIKLFYGGDEMDGGCKQCSNSGSWLNESRHDVRCLGSFVLAIRLNRQWLSESQYDPEIIRDTVSRYLGHNICSVFVGNVNNPEYITMHIRLHTCYLAETVDRTYDMSRLLFAEKEVYATPPVAAVLDENLSLLSGASLTQYCADQMNLLQRERADYSDSNSSSLVREMRVDLGYSDLPDRLYIASVLVKDLRVRLRRKLFAMSKRVRYRSASLGESDLKIVKADLIRYQKWATAAHTYGETMLPAPTMELARVSMPKLSPSAMQAMRPVTPTAPLPFSEVSQKFLAESQDVHTISGWLTKIMAFVDLQTPLWKTSQHGPVLLNDMRNKSDQLNVQDVTAIRLFCVFDDGRDPLGRRPANLKPHDVTTDDVKQHMDALRTETEVNELGRIANVLGGLFFVGTSVVGDMRKRLLQRSVCTKETGVRCIDFMVADIATDDYVATLSIRNIDKRRTNTNSIHNACRALGIEAARMTLIRQYADVFAMTGKHGATLHANLAHVAGLQTCMGFCLPISRSGAKYFIDDKFQSASFEVAPKVLIGAAVSQSRTNTILSPSSALMFALPPPGFGTSAVEIVMDTKQFLPHPVTGLVKLEANIMIDVETVVAQVYPLTNDPSTQLQPLSPEVANSARSPFNSDRTPYFQPHDHVAQPSELTSDIESLGINTMGSFSPRREPTFHKPDYTSTNGQDTSEPQLAWLARTTTAVAPTEEYDPTRPEITASSNGYDPVNFQMTDARAVDKSIASIISKEDAVTLLAAIQTVRENNATSPSITKRRRLTLDNFNY